MTTPAPEGVGCRPFLTTVAMLLGFAAAAVALGLSLILGDEPSAPAELIGLTAYGAGAPVSGLFAAVAGGLPLTLYLDALVWILLGAGIARLGERGQPRRRLMAIVVAAALVYGFAIASLVELA